MPINYHNLKQRAFPAIYQNYTERDTMLYALSLGLGKNPTDKSVVPFVYEGAIGGLRALPTQAIVLGAPGFWAQEPDTCIDWVHLLHGEQRLRLYKVLPASGNVVGKCSITHVIDKGREKGAILVVEKRLEEITGELIAIAQQVLFLRGDGGYSNNLEHISDKPLTALLSAPEDRDPDYIDIQSTRSDTALLYRLVGDLNPLHADLSVAQEAGFTRPILHGLASYALAGYSVLRSCVGGDVNRMKSLDMRFASPVYPGETLKTEIWRSAHRFDEVHLQSRVIERDCMVLSHGLAQLE